MSKKYFINNHIVVVYKENGYYYSKVGNGYRLGPFFKEETAYQKGRMSANRQCIGLYITTLLFFGSPERTRPLGQGALRQVIRTDVRIWADHFSEVKW